MKYLQIKSDSDIHWALLIDNQSDFDLFLKDRAKELYKTYKTAREHIKKYGDLSHSTRMAYLIGMALEKENCNRKNIFDDLLIIDKIFLTPFIDVFNTEKKILVWQSINKWDHEKYAGFMPYSAFINHPLKLEVIKEIEKDELIFPTEKEFERKYTEKDITINKWPEGKHYYAKIKDKDVIVKNKNKWNTYEYAYENAKKYLNQLNNE